MLMITISKLDGSEDFFAKRELINDMKSFPNKNNLFLPLAKGINLRMLDERICAIIYIILCSIWYSKNIFIKAVNKYFSSRKICDNHIRYCKSLRGWNTAKALPLQLVFPAFLCISNTQCIKNKKNTESRRDGKGASIIAFSKLSPRGVYICSVKKIAKRFFEETFSKNCVITLLTNSIKETNIVFFWSVVAKESLYFFDALV